METDVAIVGGGPAGSTLAALLAQRGIAVTLIDRDAFPRDKLCGEFLSYDALPVLEGLGVMDAIDHAGAPRIERCRVVSRHRTYTFAFPHAARGVSRLFLDDLLHARAITLGTKAIQATAETLSGGQAILPVPHPPIQAKVLAGAWGRWGRFDTQLQRAFVRDHSHRNFGFKRHYAGAHEHGTIDLYAFRRGYLGVSEVEGGITNICGLVHASRLAGHKGKWDTFVETIRAEEPVLDRLYAAHPPAQDGFLSSEPVIFRARSAVEGGIFMIGDASGIIDPLTGNGMAMAIQSALVAAPLIVRLLEKPHDRAAIEQEYRAKHRELFTSRIAWSRRVAKLLSRPALLDAALAAVRSPAVGAFLLRKTRATRDEIARRADAWFSR